eukprot:1161912-Pelagomonas_calceolata.AAC.2
MELPEYSSTNLPFEGLWGRPARSACLPSIAWPDCSATVRLIEAWRIAYLFCMPTLLPALLCLLAGQGVAWLELYKQGGLTGLQGWKWPGCSDGSKAGSGLVEVMQARLEVACDASKAGSGLVVVMQARVARACSMRTRPAFPL